MVGFSLSSVVFLVSLFSLGLLLMFEGENSSRFIFEKIGALIFTLGGFVFILKFSERSDLSILTGLEQDEVRCHANRNLGIREYIESLDRPLVFLELKGFRTMDDSELTKPFNPVLDRYKRFS
ncbi:MAG: hypothetical protein IBX55_00500 [Methyloprofundus sp.]|nr:hypothetical protein [Methyloprofundus sp.]